MDAGHEQELMYSNEALRKLGARIRHLRRRRGLTQRELSFDGCSYSYLARIEAGERRASPRVLMEIARRLDVTVEELTGHESQAQRTRSLETLDALNLIRLERYDEAEELLRGVLREAQVDADAELTGEALEGLGIVAAERGQDDLALRLLQQALEVGPAPHPAERVELYEHLFRLYCASGDIARATALVEDCLERLRAQPETDPAKLVRYATWLSHCYTDAGDYARANAVLAEALRDGAEDIDLATRARAYYSLSRIYATTGQIPPALTYADRALSIYELIDDNRALADAHLAYARALLDAAQTADAGRHLGAARTLLGPKSGAADRGFLLVEEARHALQAGETELAAARAGEAVRVLADAQNPAQLGDAHLVLARVQDELGEIERAERAYTAAIEALRSQGGWNRELAKAYRWYGKFLKRLGRADAALEAFELAADLAPSNQDAMAPVAQLLRRDDGIRT